MLDKIAIIGRPNVGKSTIFNRILGRKKALVHDVAGTTRDRNEAKTEWKDKSFILIDTGGWALDKDPKISKEIQNQMLFALEEASVVLLVADAREGLHPIDEEMATLLRKKGREFSVIVNKVDCRNDEVRLHEFYKLGGKKMIPISAIHGRNTFELMDLIYDSVKVLSEEDKQKEDKMVKVTLIGKPNVGKSSLFNTLFGKNRNIVDDRPGTTRDSVDVPLKRGDTDFLLIDTPGLHRKSKIVRDMDYLCLLTATRSLERANIAILLTDATQGIGETEAKIAQMVLENRCGCLIAINKWDLINEREQRIKELQYQIETRLQFLSWAKVVYLSAKTGQRAERVLDDVKAIYGEYSKTVPLDKLKEIVLKAQQKKPLTKAGKFYLIKDVSQTGTCPPTFTFQVKDPQAVHFSYKRYLENIIRDEFKFFGTPIILRFEH